jgi:hypothetical protein
VQGLAQSIVMFVVEGHKAEPEFASGGSFYPTFKELDQPDYRPERRGDCDLCQGAAFYLFAQQSASAGEGKPAKAALQELVFNPEVRWFWIGECGSWSPN